MLVPFTINVSPLVQQYSLSRDQVDTMLDNVVKGITARYAQTLEVTVQNSLHSTRQIFCNSIKVIDTGRLMGQVMIDYSNKLVEKLEEGSAPFDMKSSLLSSPKAKVSKNGTRYITVPFRQGVPGTIGDSTAFSGTMPEDVYAVAKKMQSKQSLSFNDLPKDYQQLKSREKIESGDTLFEKYVHKSPIYQGLTKTTDTVTNQNSYHTFRRISEKSNPNAFIHPGFQAHDFMGKTLQNFQIDKIAGNLIDEQLDQLGL
jgi:hypothetical protein